VRSQWLISWCQPLSTDWKMALATCMAAAAAAAWSLKINSSDYNMPVGSNRPGQVLICSIHALVNIELAVVPLTHLPHCWRVVAGVSLNRLLRAVCQLNVDMQPLL
jgi:hypothetical protein